MLLEFKNVSVALQPPFDTGLDGVTFVLGEGELALVRLEEHVPHIPLGDAVQGLIDLNDGEVRYEGVSWVHMKADEVILHRSRMGRVFERPGWISNLDVDENVALAQLSHTHRREQDVLEEARRLAADFQIDELPHVRAIMVPRATLRRAQWVRAFMGQPKCIILERPTREMPDLWAEVLLKKVNEYRAKGTAFLWITDEPHEWSLPALNPSLKFAMQGTKMEGVES
ncbi:MAG: hypothetical protein V1929_03085 [bacterium]